jgi:hypothetical protein
MKKPKVKLIGRDGNAFAIMGACKQAANKAKWTSEQWKEVQTKMMNGDYDNLLRVACEYFEVN